MLEHPGVAKIPCSECQKRAYDMDTGEPKTFRAGPEGELKFYDQNHKAPCFTGWKCPKESPAKEKDHLLSERNHRVAMIYHHVKASCGQVGPIDTLLAHLLSFVDRMYSDIEIVERSREMNRLQSAIARRPFI